MKKLIVALIALLVMFTGAQAYAAMDFALLSLFSDEPEAVYPTFSLGASAYTDDYNTKDEWTYAIYADMGLLRLIENAWVTFGVTFVPEDMPRSRPHFGLVYQIAGKIQVGPYYMVGPYHAWGVQLGYVYF